MNDGSALSYPNVTQSGASDCSGKLCYELFVDVKGLKGPNMLGQDLYMFAFNDNKLVPGGAPDLFRIMGDDKCSIGYGWGCTIKVLKNESYPTH